MPIVTHPNDLSLAPTVSPIVHNAGQSVAAAIQQLARQRFHAVQLDAALDGIRPRQLSSRARKDLLALTRRNGMTIAGLDLFIPRSHFTDPSQLDRAMHAALAAMQLARELGRTPLSIALPVGQLADDLRHTLAEAAHALDIRLAVHCEDQLDALTDWLAAADLPNLAAAIDPAALLALGKDPAAVARQLGRHLAVARLSDLHHTSHTPPAAADQAVGETTRCAPGQGRLDLPDYRLSLDLLTGRPGPVVLDLRSLTQPLAAAAAARQAWDDADLTPQ